VSSLSRSKSAFWLRADLIFPAALVLCLVIAASTILGVAPERRTQHVAAQILLRVMLFGFFGIGGVAAGLLHLAREESVARAIGWPPGNPFHYEVAVANLSFGVVGVLSRWFGQDFWTAAAIGPSLFVIGAGVVHVVDLVRSRNRSLFNAGAVLYVDFLAPAVTLGALLVFRLT
jgi:hypothetical protein